MALISSFGPGISRRRFLAGLALPSLRLIGARDSTTKPLRGIFPIAQTPFTEADRLDVDTLVEELRFIDRGRVPGFVWPQLASEWAALRESERLEGGEALAAEARKLRTALVLGVQAPDTATAVRYARHARKVGADAIISLPPSRQADPVALLEYYQEIGRATDLPLFVQAVGNMSVDTVIAMYKAVPTLRYVKDEAGEPLARIAELRRRSSDELKVFTGSHGRTLLDEMMRGFSGSMPAASFADLYAAAWDLWHQGKREEALDRFGRASLLVQEVSTYGIESLKYLLVLRGVFKNYRMRQTGEGNRAALDDTSRKVLRELLDLIRPSLRA
jgi:4-hydroxy-tetrahydrodipicolinate synthase